MLVFLLVWLSYMALVALINGIINFSRLTYFLLGLPSDFKESYRSWN